MRIGTTQQVAIFLKDERSIELSGAGDNQFCCRSDGVQHCTRADTGERLSRTAVSTKDVVGCNATTAKTTVDRLHLDRLVAQCRGGQSVTNFSVNQVVEVR